MTVKKFNLPDVGEGLTEAEVVAWKVKPGDVVAINDVLCEIETAKSLVELPSPFAGTVTELLVEEGITVEVGTAIIAVSEGQEGDPAPVTPAAPEVPAVEMPLYGKLPADDDTDDNRPAGGPLVGSGPKADAVKRRARKRPAGAVVEAATVAESAEGTVQDHQAVVEAKAAESPVSHRTTSAPAVVTTGIQAPVTQAPVAQAQSVSPGAQAPQATASRGAAISGTISGLVNKVLAKPPVRKFARDLGIDLADVVATGERGEVTREDLVSYQAQRDAEHDQADSFWGASKKPQDQRVERMPVKGVRKATAKAMVDSAFSAPHVSIFVDVDASRTMEFVKRDRKSVV